MAKNRSNQNKRKDKTIKLYVLLAISFIGLVFSLYSINNIISEKAKLGPDLESFDSSEFQKNMFSIYVYGIISILLVIVIIWVAVILFSI